MLKKECVFFMKQRFKLKIYWKDTSKQVAKPSKQAESLLLHLGKQEFR